MTTAERPQRPLRKDAERSRQRILQAATELLATHGMDVGFDELARVAGVGVGTVYRRFPTRDDLVEALFVGKIERLIGVAEAALTREGDPWASVVWMCEQLLAQEQADRGLSQVLVSRTPGATHLHDARTRLPNAVAAVLRRAQQAGQVRPDVGEGDVAVILQLTSRLPADQGGSALARRYLTLFLDALSVGPARRSDLPGGPPTADTMHELFRRP